MFHFGILTQQIKLADGMVQTMWPAHCVQNSHGAKLYPTLHTNASDEIVYKGMRRDMDSYSAFSDNRQGLPDAQRESKDGRLQQEGSTGLADMLHDAKVG